MQTVLRLDYNEITRIPIQIGDCEKLIHLSISHNKLEAIPAEIGYLTQLKSLNLSNNSIYELPNDVGECLVHDGDRVMDKMVIMRWWVMRDSRCNSFMSQVGRTVCRSQPDRIHPIRDGSIERHTKGTCLIIIHHINLIAIIK